MSLTLDKSVRLKGKLAFGEVFKVGKQFKAFPIKIVYTPDPEIDSFKVGFSVPVRHFKKAADRNRLRRQMKEAFRINQGQMPKQMRAIFVYMSAEPAEYKIIEEKIIVILRRLLASP